MSDEIENYVARVEDGLAYIAEEKPSGAPTYSANAVRITFCVTCLDCGAVVDNRRAHDRFHAILNDHASALAILTTSHLNERVHDRFDVVERIEKRRKS